MGHENRREYARYNSLSTGYPDFWMATKTSSAFPHQLEEDHDGSCGLRKIVAEGK
jgi:hypothetical protein